MVETARVELASESISIQLSPSASDVKVFAAAAVYRPAAAAVIPLVPRDTGHSREVSCIVDARPPACR